MQFRDPDTGVRVILWRVRKGALRERRRVFQEKWKEVDVKRLDTKAREEFELEKYLCFYPMHVAPSGHRFLVQP